MQKPSWLKRKYNKEIILSRHQAPGPLEFVIVLDHLKPGFNIGKILRSANAMGCKEVHLVGIPMFDPSPALGCLRHTKTRSFQNISESLELLKAEGYKIFALEPEGSLVLGSATLPAKCAFIVGHEYYGFSFEKNQFPFLESMQIKHLGRVQSLNVSVAASLAAFEYVRQHALQK